jgi:RhoGEF domain/Pleckstrin homology domain
MNNGSGTLRPQQNSAYDDMLKEVGSTQRSYSNTTGGAGYHERTHDPNSLFPSDSPNPLLTPDEVPTHANGNIASTGDHNINYAAFTDDSDAEAAAGLAAMQAAEEQEAAEEARRRSGSASLFSAHGSNRQSREPPSIHDVSSDSDYANVDMGLVGGGYAGHMHYGEQPQSNYASAAAMPPGEYYDRLNPRMDSVRSTGVSSEGRDSQTSGYESIPTQDALHPFPPFRTDVARVDTGGTGGLTEPSPHPRRLSFEDGDEDGLLEIDNHLSGMVSPSRDSFQDLFYHPGMSRQRPLPPVPSISDPGGRLPHAMPAGTYASQNQLSQYEQFPRPYPSAPDAYQQSLLSPSQVPRSSSLSSTRSAPKSDQPIRAKTDAEARARLLRAQASNRPMSDVYETSTAQSAVALDLPTIPRKKFNPSKLSTEQFKKCTEPWALSSVVTWLKDLADEESDLKEHAIVDAIVALFTHKVPTMNTADAETLGDRVVKEMVASATLVKEEEWVKFGPGVMTGVLFQLTGTGCYSSMLHLHHVRGRCYSHHCMRTLKKVDLSLAGGADKKAQDWATFYNLKKEDIEDKPKKEVERQNVLHEIVTSEDLYISHLDVVRVLYRDELGSVQPPVIPAKKLPSFLKEVFGQFDKVKKVNEDFLLAQLKYRQNEQGPWIVGFSDIFREWIRRAKAVYVEFAGSFPRANYMVRRELERNLLFKQFLDQARDDKRSNRLSWDTYLKDPITRLQRYALLLQTVLKNMPNESEEKMNLQFAVDEVRAATFECNSKVAEMERKISLLELQNKIRLRKGMEREVELNLDHLGREVIIRGDLQRAGGKGFAWVDTHAILFDHYLVLAKTVIQRDSAGGRKYEIYDVSKVPIPMDLIVLESTNDPAVVKSKVTGSIGAVTTTVTPRAQAQTLGRTNTNATGGPGTLIHSNTNTSFSSKDSKTIVTTTVLDQNDKDEKIMYPFRIKHLGKTEVYTLYAPSSTNRQEWCDAIIEAKTRHAASLFAQNAEPFHLRVLADTAFAYDGLSAGSRRINIQGTPLDRAIKEAEERYSGQGRPAPICRAAVNCATVFNQPYGRLMCAIGTDYGVYISEYENPRGWTRVSYALRPHSNNAYQI